jgi:orotidine-5'-phosphate decarboxylase
MPETFAARFAELRRRHGPLVLGLDPSAEMLAAWGLPPGADGLEHFVDLVLQAAAGRCAVVKPQSAFFERHGSAGVRALERLLVEARSAGLLTLLDVKRGDVGSTSEAYADAYLEPGAPLQADALTLAPYLGFAALEPFFERAVGGGGAVFVVVRSSSAAGRGLQLSTHADGRTVEAALLSSIGVRNARDGVPADGIGPVGAVFASNHGPPKGVDLVESRCLFLSPGLGAQGASVQDVAECFAACPDRVLPSASRSLLRSGPDPARLGDAVSELGAAVRGALGS